MKYPRLQRVTVCSALSGLLLALAFPRIEASWCAWFGLVPLLLVMAEHPFRSGFVAGLVFFGTVLYWLNIVMTTYGGLHPLLSLVAYLLLVAYLALYFGTATWACCRLREKLALPPLLSLPLIWVALEFLRSFLLTGFPWATLGYSQANHPVLIQSADLFGVYGISFLLILSNCVLGQLWQHVRRGARFRTTGWALLALLLLLGGDYAYGRWRLKSAAPAAGGDLQVTLVQGNIDQAVKWNPDYQLSTLATYGRLSRQAAQEQAPDLIVWPESATPFYFQNPSLLQQQVLAVPRDTGAYLLFGSPAYEQVNRRYHYLNSAFLLDPQGQTLGRSDKVHLVPFGEYVPLARFLPFVKKLVAGIGDFTPGEVNPLPMNGARLGVLVCFEAIFPELARDFVQQGSTLLVNLTNDAWFGRSSAPYQHLAMVRFRAIENRIWIARAANTGISALIAPTGDVTGQTTIFQTGFLSGRVQPGARPTWYNRSGDLLPAGCVLLTLLGLIKTRRRFVD
ncbi:MAG: apolipoprotein N-acyltransferase [Desulfuromonadaceae bacterium]